MALQETEQLSTAVKRLAEVKPDVLLVEKSVARDAQNALLERGISLALNVKRTNMDRLARCTGAQVLTILQEHPQRGIGWELGRNLVSGASLGRV